MRFLHAFFLGLSTWKPIRPGFSTCLRFPSLFDKRTQTRSLEWIHSNHEWTSACCGVLWGSIFSETATFYLYMPNLTSRCINFMMQVQMNVIIPTPPHPTPPPHQLRSMSHVCKCKWTSSSPPHPTPPHHPISCVACHMCASANERHHPHPTPPHHPISCVACHMCASANERHHPHPTPPPTLTSRSINFMSYEHHAYDLIRATTKTCKFHGAVPTSWAKTTASIPIHTVVRLVLDACATERSRWWCTDGCCRTADAAMFSGEQQKFQVFCAWRGTTWNNNVQRVIPFETTCLAIETVDWSNSDLYSWSGEHLNTLKFSGLLDSRSFRTARRLRGYIEADIYSLYSTLERQEEQSCLGSVVLLPIQH